jgi:outer membrane receptor for ferric coprogen and ferric-rhodotorulic acid
MATRFQLTNKLFTIAGIKLNKYKQHFVRTARDQDYTYDESTPTYYVGVLYDVTENVTLYTSFTDVYRPNSNKFDINNDPLESETGNNLELGFKSSWFNDDVYITGAYFDIQKKNVPEGIVGGPLGFAYKQVDGAESTGFEFEARAYVTDSWQVLAGYSQFEIESSDGTIINQNIPREQLNIHTSYDWQDFSVGVGLLWQDERSYTALTPSDAQNNNFSGTQFKQPSITTVDLFAHYYITDSAKVSLNVKNASDENYVAGYDFTTKRLAAPINYKLTFMYSF